MWRIPSRHFSTYRAAFPNAAFDSAEAISYSCRSSFSSLAKRIPLPPPPNADLRRTGYPESFAISTASSRSSTTPSLPGTNGTRASFITSLHFILSPVTSIASLPGPMNIILFFLQACAKPSFSDNFLLQLPVQCCMLRQLFSRGLSAYLHQKILQPILFLVLYTHGLFLERFRLYLQSESCL